MKLEKREWLNKPAQSEISDTEIRIVTEPHTDLWQRTYYGFRNDNAPILRLCLQEGDFSFVVRTEFASKRRYDQCGIAIYLDSENWLKASVEYEDGRIQRLGSVVTNFGYSDWATTDISADQDIMWYRLSRRGQDFRIENSLDGQNFAQMRICHLFKAPSAVPIGLYACSPEDSSFEAIFSEMSLGRCVWAAHS